MECQDHGSLQSKHQGALIHITKTCPEPAEANGATRQSPETNLHPSLPEEHWFGSKPMQKPRRPASGGIQSFYLSRGRVQMTGDMPRPRNPQPQTYTPPSQNDIIHNELMRRPPPTSLPAIPPGTPPKRSVRPKQSREILIYSAPSEGEEVTINVRQECN